MAVDTRNRRASVLGVTLAALVVLPAPGSGLGQAERQQTAACYAGILAASPVVPTPGVIEIRCGGADSVLCAVGGQAAISLPTGGAEAIALKGGADVG